jgi:hypothetical protein
VRGVSDLAALAERLRREQAQVDATRALLHAAIIEALQDGMRQVDVVRATGYTRERLRQLAEAARQADSAEPPGPAHSGRRRRR